MSMSPQAALIPRLHEETQARVRRFQSSPHLVPIDSRSIRDRDPIVHVVCNDGARARSLKEFFSSHSIGVYVFATAGDYIANSRSDRIACVVLDLNLPDISGLQVQRTLVDREGPPVVFVAALGDLDSGVHAMKNGAIDFIIEPIDHGRLLAAVENAFTRDRNDRREREQRTSLLKRWRSLTPREQDVFQYTVAGFLNKQAAAELGITENTFQVHRGRVMRKMEADSLAELVRMATRLEPFIPCVIKTGNPTRPLETDLREPGKNSMGPNASLGAHAAMARGASLPYEFRSPQYTDHRRSAQFLVDLH